jgi:hypothetical protein
MHYYRFIDSSHVNTHYFVAATKSKTTIQRCDSMLQLPPAQRRIIPIGDIKRGNRGYNAPYNWHYEESAWTVSPTAVELCDVWVPKVDSNLDYWVDSVGYICPWNVSLHEEVTYTDRESAKAVTPKVRVDYHPGPHRLCWRVIPDQSLVEVHDMQGPLEARENAGNRISLSTAFLSQGIYVIQWSGKRGSTIRRGHRKISLH